MEAELKAMLKEREAPLDWAAFDRIATEAGTRFGKNELTAAFRAKCLGLQMLAAAANKDRNKEESFQPNWTAPAAKAPLGS
jgi:hypothetical protein